MNHNFAFWSNFEADRRGFDVYQNHRGGFLACTSVSSNPEVPKGAYFVGVVHGDVIEHVETPEEGFGQEEYCWLSERWWVNIPPMRLKPPKIVTYKNEKKYIELEI